MIVDEVGRAEDEYLAHQVRVLLVSAHESDDLPAGRVLDHPGEALAHDLLKLHAAGALSGDRHLKNEGRVEEAKGSVKNAGDKVADTLTGRNRNNKRT